MDRITLHHPGFAAERPQLRPTHVRLVFAEMAKDTAFGSELGFAVRAGAFSKACSGVRDRYACKDVRKELARAGRLADRIEDEMAHTPWLRLECVDTALMAELLDMQRARQAA